MRRTLAALLVLTPGLVAVAEAPWDAGLRYAVVNGGGKPTADMPNVGVAAHYAFHPSWRAGFGVDKVEFDLEGPAEYLGLEQDPGVDTIDSKVKGVLVTAWVRQDVRLGTSPVTWFWSAGLGVSAADAEDVSGPLAGGGTFDVRTDTGSDWMGTVTTGIGWGFAKRWRLDAALRYDHYLADWTFLDRTSGATATLDTFSAPGAQLAIVYRF